MGLTFKENVLCEENHLLVNTNDHKSQTNVVFLLGTPTGSILIYELCFKSQMPLQEWMSFSTTFLSRATGDR